MLLLQNRVRKCHLGGVAVPKPLHSGKSRPWGVCKIPNKDGVSLPFELVALAGSPHLALKKSMWLSKER